MKEFKMYSTFRNRLRAAWIAMAATLLQTATGFAAPQDYRFELAEPPAKSGKSTIIKVRLVRMPDGQSVPSAIIIQTRFDMGPEGMASMTAPAKAIPVNNAGIYEIATEPSMAGNWALTLSAKVQGENETVRGTVTVAVLK